jgi:hypothetical protein
VALGRVGVFGREGVAEVCRVVFDEVLRVAYLAAAFQRAEYPLQQGVVEVDQPFVALQQYLLQAVFVV